LDRQQADLEAVVTEDVGEARRDDRLEPVVIERPHRVLARGARPEVRARHQDFRVAKAILVEHEVGSLAPLREQSLAEAGALDTFQPVARDDLIGVDVGAVQRDAAGDDLTHGLHQSRSSGVVKRPVTAVAAATAGDTRCVRPPLPCRPSKLRFEVDAHRSPGASLSGFMARHMEQPGSRQSNPAARNTWSSPSASACAFTACEPGTTSVRTPGFTFRPRATSAAARRSSIREFVHDPMNTVSIAMSRIAVPAFRPMYASAR